MFNSRVRVKLIVVNFLIIVFDCLKIVFYICGAILQKQLNTIVIMDKKDYFILKFCTSNGVEYWNTQLYAPSELSEHVVHLISLGLTIIGIKHLVFD